MFTTDFHGKYTEEYIYETPCFSVVNRLTKNEGKQNVKST